MDWIGLDWITVVQAESVLLMRARACCAGCCLEIAGSDALEAVRPRLWCGLTSGKLLVYDADSWTPEQCHVCAADSIVCCLVHLRRIASNVPIFASAKEDI